MTNSIYGKLLFNPLNRCLEAKVVCTTNEFRKHAANPLLKNCYPIGDETVIMILKQKNIKMSHPLHVGFYVLEKAKAKIYSFFYDTLKPHYGDNVSLIYSDTDSLLLQLKGVDDIEAEMRKSPLADFMDFSNYPKQHPMYDDTRQGQLGLLKSETGDDYPSEIICLQPKCYSILLNSDSRKSTAKGVNFHTQAKIRHEEYRDIHNQKTHTHFETIHNIRARACQLQTVRTVKNCLSKFETKRYYLDAVSTLGYGHPDIPKQTLEPKPTISKKRKRNARENDDDDDVVNLDLTWKRRKPGEAIFGEYSKVREISTSNSSGYIL